MTQKLGADECKARLPPNVLYNAGIHKMISATLIFAISLKNTILINFEEISCFLYHLYPLHNLIEF